MTARLTAAQARRLGIETGTSKTTAKRARAPYHSRCVKCDERFTTEAAEERHDQATRHARYELILEGTT